MISLTEKESGLAADTSSAAAKEQRLTVTGLDEKGQMFRESAPILELDGRDCQFRSKFQPELGSWVLVEFDSSKAGAKRTTVQGQVKLAQPEGLAGNMFRIQIELESAQELKIVSAAQPAKAASPALPPPAAPAPKVEASRSLKEMPMESVSRVKPEGNGAPSNPLEVPQATATVPMIREVSAPKPQPEETRLSRETIAPKPQAEAVGLSREAVTSAVAQEVKQQIAALKDSLRAEVEGSAQRAASSGMEPLIRQAVEKQIASNYQASIQTLNSDLTFQLAGRLAANEEVRASVENMVKKAIEDQLGQLRNSAIEEQRNAKANLAATTQSFEKSVAEIESKMKAADGAATAALDRAQAMEREVRESMERLQKVVDQLNQSVRSTIEKFDGHVTSQLNSWSAQFKNHVDGISREKAAQFSSGLEQQLTSQLQEANEVLEKLSAGLQLARGTARMQETQWAGRSHELAAEFEKEIRSVLLRLANPA